MSKASQWILGLVLLPLMIGAAHAADEDATARVREMLRRTQEALRQAQADNAQLAQSKAEAEQKLQTTAKELDGEKSGSRSALAALQMQLQTAQATQADLQKQLTDTSARLSVASDKLSEASKQLLARNAEAANLRQALEHSQTEGTSCEAKNAALYSYASAALQLYRHKGVWAALSQKEPVLQLRDVDIQNVVQEYQLKADSQRVKP